MSTAEKASANMEAINLEEKFALFDAHWTPKMVAQLNGQAVKIAKIQGEFVWHSHADEDEMFLVIKGALTIEFRDKSVDLQQGELCVVPHGVEHRPIAEKEAWIMLFEPLETRHTGEVESPLTQESSEWI